MSDGEEEGKEMNPEEAQASKKYEAAKQAYESYVQGCGTENHVARTLLADVQKKTKKLHRI